MGEQKGVASFIFLRVCIVDSANLCCDTLRVEGGNLPFTCRADF